MEMSAFGIRRPLTFHILMFSKTIYGFLFPPFGFGILKLFLRKAVIHFPIGSYAKNCHVSGS
jgi:hypothetical protein